jgi:hypothetical protein
MVLSQESGTIEELKDSPYLSLVWINVMVCISQWSGALLINTYE